MAQNEHTGVHAIIQHIEARLAELVVEAKTIADDYRQLKLARAKSRKVPFCPLYILGSSDGGAPTLRWFVRRQKRGQTQGHYSRSLRLDAKLRRVSPALLTAHSAEWSLDLALATEEQAISVRQESFALTRALLQLRAYCRREARRTAEGAVASVVAAPPAAPLSEVVPSPSVLPTGLDEW